MIYRVVRFVFRLLFSIGWRVRLFQVERIPLTGPVILCANHINWLDPPLIAGIAPRKLHFMAKEELFRNRLLGWFLGSLGAFPVRRGRSDRGAIRKALTILEAGGALGMFPEGRRHASGKVEELLRGAAFLSLHTGAPVIPIGISGTYRLFSPIVVRVGEPIQPLVRQDAERSRVSVDDMTRTIQQRIEVLAYGDASTSKLQDN